MSWITGAFVYLIVWWLVLFTQLSRYAGRPGEQEVNDYGAPLRSRIWSILGWTSAIAFVIWLAFYFVTQSGMFSLFELLTGRELRQG